MSYQRMSAQVREVYERLVWDKLSQGATLVANTVTAGQVNLVPFVLPYNCWLSKLGIPIENTSAGNITMGIYEDKGLTPLAGALLATTASSALGADANELKEFSLTSLKFLKKGLYWLASEFSDATTVVFYHHYGFSVATIAGIMKDWHYHQAYGALTDPCPALTADNSAAMYAIIDSIHYR